MQRASKMVRPAGAQRTPASKLRPMSEYTELDPSFDAEAFQEKMSNLYVQMQNCWQDKNIESLRPYFTDALYAQMDRSWMPCVNPGAPIISSGLPYWG